MNKISHIEYNQEHAQFFCQHDWTLDNLNKIKAELRQFGPASSPLMVNGSGITAMDSAGAWLLYNQITILAQGIAIQWQGFSEPHQQLLNLIINHQNGRQVTKSKSLFWVAALGKVSLNLLNEFIAFLQFLGKQAVASAFVFLNPRRLRLKDIAGIVEKSGYQALPIIALLSFMIGVVIAYQMGNQLKNYGANVFIVDLLGLSVLREFGPLLTAILVAGRTGSAFTAQLGIMKINQEIDALHTLGVPPVELLLIPRMLGLFIALPLLTIWADIFGIIGGMVMANSMLDVSWHDFLLRFEQTIPLRALLIGLGKAPIFALLISSISCFQGMQVAGSSESIGQRTTRSVVLAIFWIIVVDAIFSILFSKFNL